MASVKNKINLFKLCKLDKKLYDLIYDYSLLGQDSVYSHFVNLLNDQDGRQQIAILKKIFVAISGTIEQNPAPSEDSHHVVCPLQILIHLYFICESHSPARRILASFIQSCEAEIQTRILVPSMQGYLEKLYSATIGGEGLQDQLIRFEESSELRYNVNLLEGLLENFPLGEDCVGTLCLPTLDYVSKLLELFFKTFGSHLSPVQKNETMHNCLETVKLANRICQKSAVAIETQIKVSENLQWFKRIAASFIAVNIGILQTDNFLIDCKTAVAMNIALFLKCIEPDSVVDVLLHFVFDKSTINRRSDTTRTVLDWIKKLGLSCISQSSMSVTSLLCLCYGLLAMLSMESLTKLLADDKCLLLDVLLADILQYSNRCTDVGSKLLTARCVNLATQRTSVWMKTSLIDCPAALLSRLHGSSSDIGRILNYIWTIWEDTMDAIRFLAKEIFENVVNIHVLTSQFVSAKADDSFLHQLTNTIIHDISLSCKGKYGTLSILVSHIGASKMLVLHDWIRQEVLQQLQEQTLACYASELYEKLFVSHREELQSDTGQSLWLTMWIDPVLDVLCGTNKLQKKHTIEYILPRLLKRGDNTLQYILTSLSSATCRTTGGSRLGALVMCLRRARAMGQLQTASKQDCQQKKPSKPICDSSDVTLNRHLNQTCDTANQSGKIGVKEVIENNQPLVSSMRTVEGVDQSEMWCGVVNVYLLKQALSSKDEQVRLDAFALLCENQKTTEVISDTELCLIQKFLRDNMNNQNPAYRQYLLSHLKKFLSRMKESKAVLMRTVQSASRKPVKDHNLSASVNLKSYKKFLTCTLKDMLSSTQTGSTFARRTTALSAIQFLMDIFGSERKSDDTLTDDFKFYDEVMPCDIQTLLQCLNDTFEENKTAATNIIIACTASNHTCALSSASTESLMEVALNLACSTRPQDSTTAVYLFQVLLHQPDCFTTLQKQTEKSEITKETENRLMSVADDKFGRSLLLLWILLKNLQDQSDVAQSNLLVAAANRPLYPTMQCIRYTLSDIRFSKVPEKLADSWREFLSSLIKQCLTIAEVVSPVVHNCSPEGNIPVEAIKGSRNLITIDQSAKGENPDEKGDNSYATTLEKEAKETVMLMPEYLVVCCWRSIKEISLLLGQLTKDVPVSDPSTDQQTGLMSYQQILDIGQYFTVQLLESKHRGAFELAYAGFVCTTNMLWRSNISQLHQLPRDWLTEVMTDIKSNDPESRLCATRRSAGVPFYVQALVTTEPASTGRTCFKEAMTELLALAFGDRHGQEIVYNSQVHSFNILRAMYKDTRLADDVAPFVADGMKAAILGFKSPLWAVRNSATLLMSALMVRVFGVKRSKDESSLSRKNCQTGRTFFYHYPLLYQFLLDQLAETTASIGHGPSAGIYLHPGLYPVLMVLGRLFPSAMEGTDTALSLKAFVPYVIRCSSSPVLKTRVMAARALQPLVEKDHVTKVISELMTMLPCQSNVSRSQNQIHGILLQIKELLRTIPTLSSVTREEIGTALKQTWPDRLWLIDRENPCVLTRKVAVEVLADILSLYNFEEVQGRVFDTVCFEVVSMETSYSHDTPALSAFLVTVSSICVKMIILNPHLTSSDKEIEKVILCCLKSSLYEVRKQILITLTGVFKILAHHQGNTILFENEDTEGDMSKVDYFKMAASGKASLIGTMKSVYWALEGMVMRTELHHECLVQLMKLIQVYPFSQPAVLVPRLLEISKNSTRDEVLAASVQFLGQYLLEHCHSTAKTQICGKLFEMQQKQLKVIRDWTELLQESSATESSPQVQLAAAQALQQTAKVFLLEPYDFLAEYTFTYWKMVVDLLQEDDQEVKDTTASVVSALDPSIQVPVHPNIALDLLIGHMISCHGSRRRRDTLEALIGWMLENDVDTAHGEERLFDRGEMNTYRERFHFIQLVDRHFLHFLSQIFPISQLPGETTLTDFIGEITLVQVSVSETESAESQDENFSAVMFELLTQQRGLLSVGKCPSPYEDKPSYNRTVLDTLRTLILARYGLLFDMGETVKQQCIEMIQSISESCIEESSQLQDMYRQLKGLVPSSTR